MFAGSCIGVVCLVIVLEFLRRVGREYDRFIVRKAKEKAGGIEEKDPDDWHDCEEANPEKFAGCSSNGNDGSSGSSRLSERRQSALTRPTVLQQLIRGIIHMLQFGVGYFVMLLAMYYNGYFIICILLGALIGFVMFSWDLPTVGLSETTQQEASDCCG